jgi:uroporphyrinogen decarboxylase
MITSRERILTALNHQQPDRTPCNYLGTPEAVGMETAELKKRFGERISFHGTISTQKTLPFGTSAAVAEEVKLRIKTVGQNGGFIAAPAHNIQPDTPLENILSLYRTIQESKGI